MLQFLKAHGPIRSRTAQVGWVLEPPKASMIWSAPKRLAREQVDVTHAKSVRYCPAVIEHEARYFEIECPIDAALRFGTNEKTKEPMLVNSAGDRSAIRSSHLGQLVTLMPRKEWRHPERPVLQIRTPYLFVADEPIYMTQMAPFMNYMKDPWPGVHIGGRFPIHIWPRPLNWAFEWYETGKDLILRRGEPWFYVKFETEDPDRPGRIIEAEMIQSLREYLTAISEVTHYVNRTFSLFGTAKERRPKVLLVPKKR